MMKLSLALALLSAILPLWAPRAASQTRFETLYSFTDGNPLGLTAANGALYGTTTAIRPVGGNCGTVFELQPPVAPSGTWIETVRYAFTGINGDPCVPVGPPAVGADGALYGVTDEGGAYDWGTVYELQPPGTPGGAWAETVLYSFPAVTTPFGLTIGRGGVLYIGTTDGGGPNGNGTLFRLDPPAAPGGTWTGAVEYVFPNLQPPGTPGRAWAETVLYSFPAVTSPFGLTIRENANGGPFHKSL
jgi:uncharacterized repeat protein (TIGR03803 family)